MPFRSLDDFSDQTTAQVAALCLLHWNRISVITPYADHWLVSHDGIEMIITIQDLAAATFSMDWIRKLPDRPVRLDKIDGANPVDAELDDSFSLDDWLSCEALWQGYQVAQHPDYLIKMAGILYRKQDIHLKEYETLSIFYWWAGVKALCNMLYPNFFKPIGNEPASNNIPDKDMLRRNMDAQIRALTKGDITKEQLVLDMPAHRALTEMDALAKEYDDLNRKYPTK